ncbi:MAG: hypothetical protein AAGK23_03225 [Pseudomonadota bacterium]
MIRGLPASILLHVGVIGFGYLAVPAFTPPREEFVVVPIELIDIGAVNNIAPVVRREEVEPEAETVVPEPNLEDFLEDLDVLPDEVAPEEEVVPPAAAEPEEIVPVVEEEVVPEETEPEEDEPEPEPEPEEPEPEPKEEPKIVPPEPKTDALDDILNNDNLFNREREPVRAPAPAAPETELEDETPPPDPRRGAGDRTGNTARIEAIILAQMKVCWRTVEDLPEPDRLAVTIQVNLKPDGTLRGDAELVSPRRAPIGDRFMQVAIDRALRAARTCQPYRLPPDDYEEWREVVLNFRHRR